MGEAAVNQQEQPKAEEKKEGKAEEKKEDKAEVEKKGEEAANQQQEQQPPSPFVLFVDLHCMGCAKKIERSILKIRGVEGVVIDMAQNQVTTKGVVEPQTVCSTIEKKSRRRAKVLSPLPAAEGEPIPQVVASQVSGVTTVELNVNMHCDACAEQLKRKILKMKGVRTAETELSSGKVTVTGCMDANKLVEYVYRRTKKQAQVVPQPPPPEPEKPKEEPKPPEETKDGEPKAEEKKEEAAAEAEKTEGGSTPGDEAAEKIVKDGEEGKAQDEGSNNSNKEGGGGGESYHDEQSMQKMMMHYHQYQPVYVIERIPPPQLFSDENPNACCIT